MKKIMSSMAIIIAVLLASFAVSACETTKSTDEKYFTFEYVEATDSYVVAASELELPKTVFIPAEYEGKPVTAVKEGGFSGENCFALTDVVVRQQAAFEIGVGAFAGLKNLRSVDFNASAVTVGANAFENCIGLKEINFKAPVEKLTVASYAFKNAGFEAVELEAEEVYVSAYAFANCASVKALVINGLVEFDPSAVNGCTALASMTVTGNYYSEGGNVYATVEGAKVLVRYAPAAPATSFAPAECQIGAYAFRNAVNLTLIDLSNVTYVGEYAFLSSSVTQFEGSFDASAWDASWAVGSSYIA